MARWTLQVENWADGRERGGTAPVAAMAWGHNGYL
jgi:hypothetical protein